MSGAAYETIEYEVDAADRVATITLNRPDALNAFNRQMCEEIRDAWHVVKDDDTVSMPSCCAPPANAPSPPVSTSSRDFGQPDGGLEPRRPR